MIEGAISISRERKESPPPARYGGTHPQDIGVMTHREETWVRGRQTNLGIKNPLPRWSQRIPDPWQIWVKLPVTKRSIGRIYVPLLPSTIRSQKMQNVNNSRSASKSGLAYQLLSCQSHTRPAYPPYSTRLIFQALCGSSLPQDLGWSHLHE